jgi:hypothetical protein
MLPNNNETTESAIVTNIESKPIGIIKLLKMKEIRHELLISIILQISQQLSGYYAVIYLIFVHWLI